MTRRRAAAPADAGASGGLTFRPANAAAWEDIELVLGSARCHGGRCFCQRFKVRASEWDPAADEQRAHRLRSQTDCDNPESGSTSGLLAYLGDEPVGWCAVEPRTEFPCLSNARVAWRKRAQDRSDGSVWSVTCFVVRPGHRRTGISRALAGAAVDFARARGARSVEGYPMITEPGREITWGELHVGSRNAFAAAGMQEVAHPTPRRVVMRIDF